MHLKISAKIIFFHLISTLNNNNYIKKTLNITIPILLGGGILYWMYRGFDFQTMRRTLTDDMNWGWMMFSMIFGVTAQMFRGMRWRQTLAPLGENPRTIDCIHAVFISYASSLIIPRSGELTRCGVLARYDGTSFSKALGTVVTERIIDSLLILLITALVILYQARVFLTFFDETGTNINDILRGFTATGYIVTLLCGVITLAFAWYALHKFAFMTKIRQKVDNVKAGVLSLRDVSNKPLFAFYTLAIWASYFLHYWITFRCFGFMEGLGFNAAIVSFIVGSIAVIVPTPNGAGPWHFAVKTILILYGIADTDAETFVLIVHTLQPALVPLLGVFSLLCLAPRKMEKPLSPTK